MRTILENIDRELQKSTGPQYAAFDADGTLWDSDVGENFFQYQIDTCNLPALRGIDPWAYYKQLKAKHPPDAYLWLAQICKDHSLETVRDWATKAVKKFPLAVYDSQKELIAELLKRKINVFVVSASVHWSVEGAVPFVGLGLESALGVQTEVIHGMISEFPFGPVTWRAGKSEALLQKTKGTRPLFCSGNTTGDTHLLQISQTTPLAIQSQRSPQGHPQLHSDEQQLLQTAVQNQWLTHEF